MRILFVTAALAVACAPSAQVVSTSPLPLSAPPAGHLGLTRAADVRAVIDSLVTQPKFRTAQIGVLIVNPSTGDTLYSRNAEKLQIPASNMKLLTGAVALAQLGADYRYRTTYAVRGARADSSIVGDLVVIGRGDPTVSDRMRGDAMQPLRDVADSLLARGIRRITGRILTGGNAFPGPVLGAGWQWDYLDDYYAAPIDELIWNEGMDKVSRTVSGRDTIVEIVTRDATASYLRLLHLALTQKGISVGGTPGDTTVRADTAGLRHLFVTLSPPIVEILAKFEKPSQNQIGEILLRTIGLERTGVGAADSGRVVMARQLRDWGLRDDQFFIHDGSGLSRNNLVSPEALVSLLTTMSRRPDFGAFYASLPVAGVDGTLEKRMAGTAAAGNLRAKTGTLSRVKPLSGYVTTARGDMLVFSIMANNFSTPNDEIIAIQDLIGAMLASYGGATR